MKIFCFIQTSCAISSHVYLWTKQTGGDVYHPYADRDLDSSTVLVLTVISHPWISVFNTAAPSLKQEYISFITDNSYVKLSGD